LPPPSRQEEHWPPDEHALAESIKRRLAASGRPDDALAFADLHSKLSARSRPADLWALLYLLDSLSSHRRAAAAVTARRPTSPAPPLFRFDFAS
jgi:gamma-tubulin complex component 3